ncbi:MAG: hypothetical protein R8J94_23465 [Acidimicrobiia bacterium]|nr:hypothetical protein [Acidimicrobiia bacterium]
MTASDDVDDALFWDVAEPMLAAGKADEGELMRSRCIRVGKEFLAMPEYRTGDLIVKLPKARVAALIEAGDGLPFAPAKKIFSEWVQVPARDESLWTQLLDEGYEFVS